MAAMVNMTSLLNGKDSRWLQLEVCREFQRNKCSRQDTECKFAHPPANVEVQNGKVTACYDSIKGRCNRDKPPCKYFHPPQHLKDQLLINGRNHLALKNALMQQMGIAPGQPVIPGQVQTVATNPYLTGIPASTYSPYFAPGHLVPALLGPDPTAVASQLGPVVPQAVQVTQQKLPRSDRLEVCREFMRGACKRAETECRFAHPQDNVPRHDDGSITVCMDAVKGRCTRDPCRYFHPPLHLQAQLKAAHSRATAVAAAAATAPVRVSAAMLTQQQQQQSTPSPSSLSSSPSSSVIPPTTSVVGAVMPASGIQSATNVAAAAAMAFGQQHPLEVGKKRAATDTDIFQLMDVKTVGSFYYENFAYSGMVPIKRPAAEKYGNPVYPGATTYQQLMQLQQPFVPVSSSSKLPLNASYVIYTDDQGQLLDTLPVCQDFNRSMCSRLNCRFVHLTEDDKVEVCEQRVAVCRDHANGQCRRKQCKYYHIPIILPPANIMAALIHNNNSNSSNNSGSYNASIISSNTNNLNNIQTTVIAKTTSTLQQQQQCCENKFTTAETTTTIAATPNVTATAIDPTNYNNNNLIFIETQQQQQQRQHNYYKINSNSTQGHKQHPQRYHQQQHQQQIGKTEPAETAVCHTTTAPIIYHNSPEQRHQALEAVTVPAYTHHPVHYTTSTTQPFTTHYQQPTLPPASTYNHQQQQQHTTIQYIVPPYSPSGNSTASSCSSYGSKATSPTLSSTTTHSTKSTANYLSMTAPPPVVTTFLNAAPAMTIAIATQAPLLMGGTDNVIHHKDYSSNYIPILTTPPGITATTMPTGPTPLTPLSHQHHSHHRTHPPATAFIYPAPTPQTQH